MESSRQALQTNGKLYFKFRIRFQIIGRKPKNIRTNRGVHMDIHQRAMCYTSIDSSRHALQTKGKLFSNFGIIFFNQLKLK